MTLELALNERENVAQEIVDIERRCFETVITEHRADTGDSGAGTMAIIDDSPH